MRTRDKEGKYGSEYDSSTINRCRELYIEGLAIIKISEIIGISKTHVWRLCKDIERPRAKVKRTETGLRNKYDIRGEITAIYLTRVDGTVLEALVDTDDLQRLLSFSVKWYANYSRKTKNFYVHADKKENGTKTLFQLHRWITKCPDGMVVDHINFNPLDNRKCNLRILTDAENKKHVNPSRVGKNSIRWMPKFKKWKVKLGTSHLGYFDTRELADEVLRKEIESKYEKPASI